MRQIKEFKIRCSAIGKIMTNPRSKKETISKTCKTYCIDWLKEQVYNRRKKFTSKYTQKGIEMEDKAIDFVGEMTNRFLVKNEAFYFNGHITGTPDIRIGDEMIIDIKCSWDAFTFPLFASEVPNKDYWWQLQGYMAITGCKSAQLTYVLIDAPEHIIEGEARRKMYSQGETEMSMEMYDEVYQDMTYDDVDGIYKIKTFNIERDETAIAKISERVELCREYIKELCSK